MSWKKLTGGFSCFNTRLSFDTELLLPNVNSKLAGEGVPGGVGVGGDDNMYKDCDYKICYRLNRQQQLVWKS